MKPIPTRYRGVTFRSRLEASYAKHFDDRQLPWMYEPEGFELSDGTRYLPDFWLPTVRAWGEVKGPHGERLDKLERFSADLWAESGATDAYDIRSPMVLKFNPPKPPDDLFPWWTVSGPINVIGNGAGSTVFTYCPECDKSTIIALWQPWCRNCGTSYNDPEAVWSSGELRRSGEYGVGYEPPYWAMEFENLSSAYRPPMLYS